MIFESQLTELLHRRPVIMQFMRFACIGFLNTGLDFLVFNTIFKALGIF